MEKKELNVRDLSQEELKSILGGTTSNGTCPKCGSNNVNGTLSLPCLVNTSYTASERLSVDIVLRRNIKTKTN